MKRWLAASIIAVGLAKNIVHGQPLQQNSSEVKTEGTKWQLSHRLQGGWEHDSNIYEASSQLTIKASGSARFLLSTRGDRRNNLWQIHYDYAAALQTYPGFGNENKLSHDLNGLAGVRLKSWLQVSAKANATLKFYLENVADYGTTSGNLTVSVFLPHQITVSLGGETGQLDYAAEDDFDFTFRGLDLGLRRALSSSGLLEAALNRRAFRYQRPAQAYGENQTLLLKSHAQRDALTTLRVALTYGRKIVTQIALETQANRSNSFGYDFKRLRVSGLLGFRPARGWMLRAAGLLQNKRYRDDLAQLNLRDLDTEREQSNFLVVDLSRDLSAEISLVTRAAFYDNESTVPGIFYRKILYFTGVEIRL